MRVSYRLTKRALLLFGLVLFLSSCAPALDILDILLMPVTPTSTVTPASIVSGNTLQVINHCLGSNATVDVYIDGRYYGAVYYSRTFYGISSGSRFLIAEGTGYGGSRFTRSAYFNGNVTWTLC
jgi:hypothetical protein